MNDQPLVSVIVTTYNRKELLKETIDSILNQTFIDFELIVVDNFSDYDFFEHIQLFCDNRIKPFQNHNKGIIAINRNFGIKEAKGEYIAFCDDDDLWIEKKLEEQLEKRKKNKVDMVYSICKSFDDVDLLSNMYGIFPLPNKVRISREGLLYYNTIPLSTVLIRKKILDNFNGFDTSEIYFGIEDYELWIRLIESISVMFIPRVHTLYRIHFGMTQLHNSKKEAGLKKLHQRYGSIYNNNTSAESRSKPIILLRNIYHNFFKTMITFGVVDFKLFRSNYIKQ